MIFLSSSSFFLPDYLTKKLGENNYRSGQLTYGLKHHHIAALTIKEKAADFDSMNWLALNQKLGKSQASTALKLGHWYQNKSQQESKTVLINTAIMWFEQAIRLGSQQAAIVLAQLYFKQEKLLKAQTALRQLPATLKNIYLAENRLVLSLEIAVYQGDVALVKQLLTSNTFKRYGDNQAQRLLADLNKYSVITNTDVLKNKVSGQINSPIGTSLTCITSLQLYATNLAHLKHLEQLIKTFKEQQVLAPFICLPTPRYISKNRIDCMAQAEQAISCDETRWQSEANQVSSRHIGLMLKEGGANVHLGILYFDVEDSADVFSHELSHLLGFVDEYPLSKDHETCQDVQQKTFAHNIAVLNKYYQGERDHVRASVLASLAWASEIKVSTPILQAVDNSTSSKKIWRLGTPIAFKERVGVYLAESCQQSSVVANATASQLSPNYSAFKPLNRRTQLRYFANEFPEEYLTLLKAKPSNYLMPSFHYNIAFALYQQGNNSRARYWLRQAAEWESEPLRKLTILSGDF